MSWTEQTYIELVLPRLGLGSHGGEQQHRRGDGDGDGGRGGHAGRDSRGGRHFSARFPSASYLLPALLLDLLELAPPPNEARRQALRFCCAAMLGEARRVAYIYTSAGDRQVKVAGEQGMQTNDGSRRSANAWLPVILSCCPHCCCFTIALAQAGAFAPCSSFRLPFGFGLLVNSLGLSPRRVQRRSRL